MASKMIEQMVRLVQRGHSPKKVWESSLCFAPGSSVLVNQDTEAKVYMTNESTRVAKGTVVTIVGVGGGNSGVDHHARLPDGKQVIIPFAALGGVSGQG